MLLSNLADAGTEPPLTFATVGEGKVPERSPPAEVDIVHPPLASDRSPQAGRVDEGTPPVEIVLIHWCDVAASDSIPPSVVGCAGPVIIRFALAHAPLEAVVFRQATPDAVGSKYRYVVLESELSPPWIAPPALGRSRHRFGTSWLSQSVPKAQARSCGQEN